MVGSLAMASSIEDYSIQPCKKPRKDDDPAVKTITNYFSPLAKTVDKVFSPPKSNIRDYFKSTPPKKDIFTPNGANIIPNVKPSNSKDPPSPVTAPQTSLKCKKRGKRINLQSVLGELKPPERQSGVEIISDDSHQSQETEAASRSVGFMGSDTASLLAQICNENVELSGGGEPSELSSTVSVPCKKTAAKRPPQRKPKNDSKKSRKRKFEDDGTSSTPSVCLENQTEEENTGETKTSTDSLEILSSSLIENQSTSIDSSLEVHVDETSKINSDSVVTVSFEDFLKSQGEREADQVLEAAENSVRISDALEAETSVAGDAVTIDDESVYALDTSDSQLSIKTLTVLALVHSSPPKTPTNIKQEAKTKIASIFLKKNCELEMECNSHATDVEHAEQIIQKRKSNVVIEEEDLELAVLEVGGSESTKPRSTVEERQQFMKCFRQPASDSGKSVAKKACGKPQELNEKLPKERRTVNEGADNDLNKNSVKNKRASRGISESAEPAAETNETTGMKTKKLKKRGKKVVQTSDVGTANKVQGTLQKTQHKNIESTSESTEDNLKKEKPPVLEKREIALRRSSRQQSAEMSQIKTPIKSEVVDAFSENVPDHGPPQVSTPKVGKVRRAASGSKISDGPSRVSTPKGNNLSLEKNNLYKSEMLMSLETHSPIRMRFTRLSYRGRINDSGTGEDAEFTPRSRKVIESSKKISEAKKLVKKAKTIKHNLSKSTLETQTLLRRSSRQQARSERQSDHETEDCVLVDSGSAHTPAKRKLKKNTLRSLNDVLGKSCKSKPARNLTAEAKTSLRGKKDKTPSGPITIDDSSKDASEDSQDEEQCKAKREFLQSGLPDSLKRHIAKTTAAIEAYSAASLCYQAVTHVQQKDGCLMWRLTWPSAPSLNELRQPNAGVTDITKRSISLGTFSDVNSTLNKVVSADMLSGWRVEFSEAVRRCLLEEIRSCNPQFPVRTFFKLFLKRRTENRVLPLTNKQGSTDSTNPDMNRELMCCSDSEKENKRKPIVDLKSKRRKTSGDTEAPTKAAEVNPVVSKSRRRSGSGGVQAEASIKGKVTRAARKKQHACAETPAEKAEDCKIILMEDSASKSEAVITSDLTCEDVLWTEKYQPQDSSELIGNSGAIKKLHSWLKEWKARADREEKRSQREKKPDENKQQDTWGQSDFEDCSEDEEDLLCNTVLVTGPPGVGKTAAVYACAQELGFKVFEVNASCQRSGRQILSQLKEATQSHQVDKQGLNAHKPCFFNSSNASKSPRKVNSPREVVASPRKPPLSPRGAGLKRGLPPKSLTQFFKPSSKQKKDEDNRKEPETIQIVDLDSSKGKEGKSTAKDGAKAMEKEGSEESNRKSATSLILFEEVDVIFDDDLGFLSAIKTFMTTTKRPVILTTSDPTFSLLFDGLFEEIHFKTPSPVNIASYLQVLCLAENLRTDVKDFATLLAMNNCDIRRSVLFLQYWVRSGGGYMKDKTLSICEKSGSETVAAGCAEDSADLKMAPLSEVNSTDLPKCTIGCAENLMGLKNILSPSEDLISFIKYQIIKTEEWTKLVRLLQEFQMKNVNFIFNNLECLLPLPVQIQEPCESSNAQGEKTDTVPPDATSLLQDNKIKPDGGGDGCADASPVKVSGRMKRRRKLELLNDSDLYECDSNSGDTFLTLPKETLASGSEETKGELTLTVEDRQHKFLKSNVGKRTCTPAEKQCSALISQCLDPLTKFVDDVSFLDCCLYSDIGEQNEFKHMEYNWTSGRIKHGLCDGHRVENIDWWSTQSCGELKAIVEVLSFQNCCSSISQAMESSLDTCKKLGKDPTEELTLHVSKHRDDVFFSRSAVSASLAQKRLSLVKNIFSNRSFMTVGNREASIVEYLPILRNICKSEKLKEQGKIKRRFLHYFEAISLELPKATLRSLSDDFP